MQLSSRTFTVSSAEGQQQFTFLRYAFPVWLSVRAENAAGLGDMSQYLKYTNQPQSDCVRISDSIVSQPASKVTFIDSTSYLEIALFQLPSENGADYCFDTVKVIVSDSGGDVSPSHTLVPRLSGTEVSVELVSGLEEDTHFTASLFFDSQLIATINFATYDVQDISVSPLPNGLAVQCVFAVGSTDDTCRVVLVLDGEKVMEKDVVRGVVEEFSNLATGTYTVLVYDSGADVEGSGPAVETTVAITGEAATTESPTTTTGTGSDGTDPSSSPTSEPTDEEDRSSGGDSVMGTYIILVVIGVAVLSILVLIAVLIVIKMYRNKSSNYSVNNETKKKSQRPSGSNPFPHFTETNVPSASSNVIYDDIVLPLSTSAIPTEPNTAYAASSLQPDSVPPIHTDANVAYSVLPPHSSPSAQLAHYETVEPPDNTPLYEVLS